MAREREHLQQVATAGTPPAGTANRYDRMEWAGAFGDLVHRAFILARAKHRQPIVMTSGAFSASRGTTLAG